MPKTEATIIDEENYLRKKNAELLGKLLEAQTALIEAQKEIIALLYDKSNERNPK